MQTIKSLFGLLVFSACACTELLAVDVNFQDVDLEIAIREVLEKPEGPITDTDMASLVSLTINERTILYLTGLEHAINLVDLDLSKNLIIDTSPLSGLAQLQTLNLFDNIISDFSPLAELTQLTSLDLEFNLISEISPLTGLT